MARINNFGIPGVGTGILLPHRRWFETPEAYKAKCDALRRGDKLAVARLDEQYRLIMLNAERARNDIKEIGRRNDA